MHPNVRGKNKKRGRQNTLTNKQLIFCQYKAEGCTNIDAYIKAGYSMPSSKKIGYSEGCRLANKPSIKAMIEKMLSAKLVKIENRSGLVAPDEIIINVKAIAQMAIEDRDLTNALRAYELLGKTISLFKETKEITETQIIINSNIPPRPVIELTAPLAELAEEITEMQEGLKEEPEVEVDNPSHCSMVEQCEEIKEVKDD